MRTFEEIYRTKKALVYQRILSRICPNTCLAEELTNNVFVKINQHLDKYNPELSAFDTWMFTITNNIIKDYYRSLERKNKMKTNNIESYVDSDGKEYFEKSTYDPTFELTEQTLTSRVEKILATIKNKKAVEVAKMRLYEGISYDEISESLGLTIINAKVMFNRVRERLQIELTSYAM